MRRVVRILSLIVIIPILSFAQSKGKIAGNIKDKATGEPLPYVNVAVEGTTLGAVSSISGDYTILNVPPGTYKLKVSYVGYKSVDINEVRVNIDLTTTISVTMEQEAIKGEVIEVTAERPLVQMNATNAVRIQTSEEIKSLPVRGQQAYFAIQPGVVVQNNNVYIRGGRADETGFFVEGANSKNILTGANQTTIIPEALEEFQIQAGGYSAQYGGANGGIINQSYKEGGSKYHASLQMETDNFAKSNETALGTWSYGYSDYVATVSGPVPGFDKAKFFFAGENQYYGDRQRKYFPGISLGSSRVNSNGEYSALPGDTTRILSVGAGNIHGNAQNRYTGNGTISVDMNPFLLKLSGSFSWVRFQTNTAPIINMFNLDRLPVTDQSDALITAKLTHLIKSNIFYSVKINYYDRRSKTYDPIFKDNWFAYNDSLQNDAHGSTYRTYTSPPAPYIFYGFTLEREGGNAQVFRTGGTLNTQKYFGTNVDFTAQIGKHEFQGGGEFSYHTLRAFGGLGGSAILNQIRNNPDQARLTPADGQAYIDWMNTLRIVGRINHYGYDVMGNTVDDGQFRPKHPVFGALYVQDKFEINDLVINAGLRYDYFLMDDRVLANPLNPTFDLTQSLVPYGAEKQTPARTVISPRLGFAFPVTDRTVFHVQYGKFAQAPQLNTVFKGASTQSVIFGGGNYVSDPIGYNLQPVITTQYEVGFNQALGNYAAFDITGFYRDEQGQIQVKPVTVTSGATAASYTFYTNGDFATIKGLEFTMTLRRVERVQAQLNYTLSDGRGTGSLPNSAAASVDQAAPLPTVISPLDYNQTHKGTLNVDYRFGKNDGGPVLERMGLNLLLTFNSGHPYTLAYGAIGQQGPENAGIWPAGDNRSRRANEAINSSSTPWIFNLDFRLDKTVNFRGFDFNFYVYAINALDLKQILNVYERTGTAYSDGWLEDPASDGVATAQADKYGNNRYKEFYRAINYENREHLALDGKNDVYGTPRQIRFGVSVQY